MTVIKAIAAADGKTKGNEAYLTKYQMITICKNWLKLREKDMSKLAHSNQETMDEIDRQRMIGNGGRPMTLQELLEQRVLVKSFDGSGDVAVSPEFRVAYQGSQDGGAHFIIHMNGHNSETLDFIAKGDQIERLQSSQS